MVKIELCQSEIVALPWVYFITMEISLIRIPTVPVVSLVKVVVDLCFVSWIGLSL